MSISDPPLLIYHHIPKTGGTSLLHVVKANYGPGEVADLYQEIGALHSDSADRGVPVNENEWYRAWYKGLAEGERQRIRCVASHTAHHLMPTLGRSFRAFCLLRDPVERVWSLYHFVRKLAESEHSGGRGALSGHELKRRGWSLVDLYGRLGGGGPEDSTLHDRFHGFFNGQTRSVLSPWVRHSELEYWRGIPPAGAMLRDRALEILQRHYVVGTHERYGSSLRRLGDAFGWSDISPPHLRQSPPRGEPDEQTRAAILDNNRIDAELHGYFSQ